MTHHLYPHQVQGIQFMVKCLMGGSREEPRGVLLADGLGLGKTRQVIGTLMSLDAKRNLILVPASVILHWLNETKVMNYNGVIIVVHNSACKTLPETCPEKMLVITTYMTFQNQKLYNRQWDFLALDEATQCKNSKTIIAKLVKRLVGTPYKVAVTATPSQNCLSEVHSLFEFLKPNLLGPKDVFDREFSLPVKIGAKRGAQQSHRDRAACVLQTLQRMIKPFVLRRTMNMPKGKTEIVVWTDMTSTEESVYESLKADKAEENSLRAVLNGMHPLMKSASILSSKQVALLKMVRQFLCGGHSVAIFVNRLDLMKWLKLTLQEEHDIPVGCISGSVPCDDRQALIDAFNHKAIKVLILTSRSSATGINLTSCGRSIIANGDYNEAIDTQAAGRSHRMTSTVDSYVYRLVTRGTVEEHVYETALRKTTTNRALLKGVSSTQHHEPSSPMVIDDDALLVTLDLTTESHDKIVARAALDEQEFQRFQTRYALETKKHTRTVAGIRTRERRDTSTARFLLKQLFQKNQGRLNMKTVLGFYDTLVKKKTKSLAVTPEAYRSVLHKLSHYHDSIGFWVLKSTSS